MTTRNPRFVHHSDRFWGVWVPVACWIAQGIVVVAFVGEVCDQHGGHAMFTTGAIRAIVFALSFAALLASVWAGLSSYRAWHRMNAAGQPDAATQPFLALAGLFVSISLILSLAWISLSPLLLHACEVRR